MGRIRNWVARSIIGPGTLDNLLYERFLGNKLGVRTVGEGINSRKLPYQIPDTYAGRKLLATNIAGLDLNVYEVDDNGDRKRVTKKQSAAVRALDDPGGMYTAPRFWAYIVNSMLLHGRALAIIGRLPASAPNDNLRLLPCDPAGWRVEVVTDKDLLPSEYLGTAMAVYDGEYGKIPQSSMLDFVYDEDLMNNAIAPLKAGRITMETLHEAGDKLRADVFAPDFKGQVKTPEMDNDAIAKAQEMGIEIEPFHVSDEGIVFIPENFDYSELSGKSSQQLQLSDLRRGLGADALKYLNLSPAIVGDMERGSYRTVEAALKVFTRLTVRPILTMLEREIDKKLLEENQYAKFDTRDLLRGDPYQEAQVVAMLRTAGVYSRNQCLQRLGEPKTDNPKDDEVVLNPQLMVGDNAVMPQSESDEPQGADA